MSLKNFSDVVIIGAGITSLSCALVIVNAGYSVKIIGISNKSEGGIQLATNSFTALKEIGLLDKLNEELSPINSILIKNLYNNTKICEFDIPKNQNYGCISRETLKSILLQKVMSEQKIQIHNEVVITLDIDKKNGNEKASIITKDGNKYFCDHVIGTDGKNGISIKYFDTHFTQSSSHVAIVAEMFSKNLPETFQMSKSQLWVGNGCHLVTYPIEKYKKINIVFCHSQERANLNWKDEFKYNFVLKDFINTKIQWKKIAIPKSNCLQVWQRGKLTVIGETAHNISPHLAQGMGQNFMDIALLKKKLQKYSLEESLSLMTSQRSIEIKKLILKAELTGKVLRLKGFKSKIRNLFLGLSNKKFLKLWLTDVWNI